MITRKFAEFVGICALMHASVHPISVHALINWTYEFVLLYYIALLS